MNHERNWRKSETTAREIAKNLFGLHGLKTIEYTNYPEIDMKSTMVKFSLNVMTYIIENNDERKAVQGVDKYLNCLSCDLETFIK